MNKTQKKLKVMWSRTHDWSAYKHQINQRKQFLIQGQIS
jgi:hypothetical protein